VNSTVDLHKHLIEVPAPLFAAAHSFHPLTTNFSGKHRTKPVPPIAHYFVANLDPTLMQEVLHVAQRQLEPNVEQHRQADDLCARLEVAKGERWVIPKGYADALPSSSQFLQKRQLVIDATRPT
jgi:hypothetical protein